MSKRTPSRRDFLGQAAAGLSTTTLASAHSAGRIIGANDRIHVGLIGLGNIGTRHLHHRLIPLAKKNAVEIVALSDVFEKAKRRALEMTGLASKNLHHEYQELLSRSDVDAVVVATPDHWHARMTLDALRAGKDVYLEKPMSYTIAEARDMAAAVRDHNRVLQVGSQHCSDPRYHHARDVIAKGWIGQPLWAQSSYSSNSIYGSWNNYFVEPEATPETVDWDRFLGPAPKRPFSGERFYRWRKYWDYSGGIATDLFYHRLSPMLLALGPRFPQRVSGHGGIYVFKDREVPDTFAMNSEYDEFYITLSSSAASGSANRRHAPTIYGHEGTIEFVAGAIEVKPEAKFRAKFEKATGKSVLRLEAHPSVNLEVRMAHMENFLDSVRSRKQPVFDADFGYKVMTAIKLGVDSYRRGEMMAFDAQSERVVKRPADRPGYEGTGENYSESRRLRVR
jgi:predicted dehydrogenase